MTPEESFEAKAREQLADSLAHVNAHVRSRLMHARREAVAVASERSSVTHARAAWLRARRFAPVAGLAAALAVAVFLWIARPGAIGTGTEPLTAFDNVSLLADSDGLEMVEDADASFYEWAAGQT